MKNYALAEDEVILLTTEVYYNDVEDKLLLTLTSKKIIIEKVEIKKVSLLKKEEDKKVINIVNISDIKLYNNKVQVHQKNTEVYIQTIKNNFTIKFDNAIEAVKFVTKVTDAVTGTTISDRGVKKVKNAFDKVDDVLGFDTRGTVKGVIENGITGTLLKGIKRKNKQNNYNSIHKKIICTICRSIGDHIKYNLMYH